MRVRIPPSVRRGRLAESGIAPVSKTVARVAPARVRIPHLPPERYPPRPLRLRVRFRGSRLRGAGSSPAGVTRSAVGELGCPRRFHTPKIVGSNPTCATNPVSSNGRIRGCYPRHAGSSPAAGAFRTDPCSSVDRAPVSEAGGRRFDSGWGYYLFFFFSSSFSPPPSLLPPHPTTPYTPQHATAARTRVTTVLTHVAHRERVPSHRRHLRLSARRSVYTASPSSIRSCSLSLLTHSPTLISPLTSPISTRPSCPNIPSPPSPTISSISSPILITFPSTSSTPSFSSTPSTSISSTLISLTFLSTSSSLSPSTSPSTSSSSSPSSSSGRQHSLHFHPLTAASPLLCSLHHSLPPSPLLSLSTSFTSTFFPSPPPFSPSPFSPHHTTLSFSISLSHLLSHLPFFPSSLHSNHHSHTTTQHPTPSSPHPPPPPLHHHPTPTTHPPPPPPPTPWGTRALSTRARHGVHGVKAARRVVVPEEVGSNPPVHPKHEPGHWRDQAAVNRPLRLCRFDSCLMHTNRPDALRCGVR